MIIALIMLSILVCLGGYVIYNLYSKYSALEEIAKENVEFILSVRSRVLSQQSYLKQLDRKGAFESDDEVGIFFKELKKIISDIAMYLEIENNEQTDDKTSEPQQVRGRIQRF